MPPTTNNSAALELCPFNIIPQKELILQVQAALYLVFMVESNTIFIEWLNSTSRKRLIPKGVTPFNVSPSCQANLPNHVIISDV
jgi:hypothetical protein